MQSKEAIRNKILTYTQQIWGTKKVERLDFMAGMLIENLVNELYLVQNKLHAIDSVLLEKIARKITPPQYISRKPAHTILQTFPQTPVNIVDKSTAFTLNTPPEGFIDEKAEAITFHPVTDTQLFNIRIHSLFHHKHLYSLDATGKKQVVLTTQQQATHNAYWVGLEIDENIQDIKGVAFYMDFPHLSEIHEYYDILSYTQCFIQGKEVKLAQKFPVLPNSQPEIFDRDILQLYNNHYLTLDEPVHVNGLQQNRLPEELRQIIPEEKVTELTALVWVKLQFLSNFSVEDLKQMILAINTFPVSNKKLKRLNILVDNFNGRNALTADIGEKLLAVESIRDNRQKEFISDRIAGNNDKGTYHIEEIHPVFIEENSLTDYISHLLSLMDEERSAFPQINREQMGTILSSLTESKQEKAPRNSTNKETINEIARVTLVPYESTTSVSVQLWVTYGKAVEGVPPEALFTPDKTSKLDGAIVQSLCEVHGSKEFTDIRDIMLVDKYLFTSKDRIITDHNIISFCESELGRAVEKVEIELGGKISPRPKEGLIRTIIIHLTPSESEPNLIHKKGTLKSLKVKLQERSPYYFNYTLNIL